MKVTAIKRIVTLAALAAAAGCGDGGGGSGAVNTGSPTSNDLAPSIAPDAGAPADATVATSNDASVSPTSALTDAQIATIVLSADRAEIAEAQLAAARSPSAAVRAFAMQLITERTASEQRLFQAMQSAAASTGAGSMGFMVAATSISEGLDKQGAEALALLEPLTGTAFDSAWITLQTQMHQQMISLLDSLLVPGATSPSLRTWLASDLLPMTRADLAATTELRAQLGFNTARTQ